MSTENVPIVNTRWWGRRTVLVICSVILTLAFAFKYYLWREEQHRKAIERLKEVASVEMYVREWPIARYLPSSLRLRLKRGFDIGRVQFHKGVTNSGRYLRDANPIIVGRVIFESSDLTGDDLAALSGLRNLRELTIRDCRIEEGAFETLTDLPLLNQMDVVNCQLGPNNVIDFPSFPVLRFLNLSRSRFSDSLLSRIRKHSGLHLVDLNSTTVSDVGLQHLQQLPNLSTLLMGRTRVTGNVLSGLGTPFAKINLAGTNADDAVMESLSHLETLRSIDLARTKVTGAGVRHLKKLSGLRSLVLDRCPVDNETRALLTQMQQLQKWSAVNTQMTWPTTSAEWNDR